MATTKKEVYTSRFWRHGGSKHVIIPKEVHEAMHLKEGDQIAMRVIGPVLVMRKITARMVLDNLTVPSGDTAERGSMVAVITAESES